MLNRIRSLCLNTIPSAAFAVLLAIALPVSAGTTIEYHYDAVGNIVSIQRAGTALNITSFSPTSGPVGAEVVIYGSGFSANPSGNDVYFDEAQAAVLHPTSSALTVKVPAGATTGTIRVTAQGKTAYSKEDFVVEGGGNPPTLSAQSISGITSTGATIRATSNFAATAYWVLRPAGSPVPTAAQIVAEAGANTAAMSGGTAFSRALTGLNPGTAYQLHFVAGNAGGYSAVWSATFTTTAVTPTLSARNVTEIGTTTVTFTATSNVIATGYWVVRLASQPIPTAAQIAAEAGANTGTMTAGVPFVRTHSDLTPGTAYRLHFVANNGGRYSTVWSAAFTTAR